MAVKSYYQFILLNLQEDVLPLIIQNNMGHVIKGELFQLTPDLLSAKVMDTNNAPSDDIVFTLSPPINNPKEGKLFLSGLYLFELFYKEINILFWFQIYMVWFCML